ncbi:GntR family transcriptional regulator [Angustibacter sp. Root456]|nr:GntR family transcriptional regulator [Angustibacter sp. Root456]
MTLDRTTLREQCLTMLRSAITAGELPAGTRLVETELSASFGISRGTLREALRALQQEGLVVASDGGLRVRAVESRELHEIFAVRAALEALAVDILCSMPDRTDVTARLRAALRAMDDQAGDLAQQAEADLEFHHLLCELTTNETLVRSWEFLSGHVRATIMRAGPERALHNMNVARHSPIVDAIEFGDAERASRIVREHMHEAADRLSSALADATSASAATSPH